MSWPLRLTKAKEILCDKKKRQQYDSWRRSGLDISFDVWLKTDQSNHMSMHWAPHPKKKKMIENCEAHVAGKYIVPILKVTGKSQTDLQKSSGISKCNVCTVMCCIFWYTMAYKVTRRAAKSRLRTPTFICVGVCMGSTLIYQFFVLFILPSFVRFTEFFHQKNILGQNSVTKQIFKKRYAVAHMKILAC